MSGVQDQPHSSYVLQYKKGMSDLSFQKAKRHLKAECVF